MLEEDSYTPPRIWQPDTDLGGTWGSINRPVAGATHEQELPRGRHPLQLYSQGTPNGNKVTILLEELLAAGYEGAEYDAWLININEKDQFGSGFVELNPNSKIPALLDVSVDPPQRVFESGSILLYLADKFGAFLPGDGPGRTETLNWLFWQMGSTPYLGGGFGHFYKYAPHPMAYPINRYTMEVKRQLDVLDRQLADHAYLAGDEYSIADIATWPWYGGVALDTVYGAAEFLEAGSYGNVMRWAREIRERPAVQRGWKVNRLSGKPENRLRERHDAADFDRVPADTAAG